MTERVIVALDCESRSEALALVAELGDAAQSYKVGLQLLTEAGPDLVRALVGSGKQVFLDLKLHEIPNSAEGAVTAAGKLGVSMVSVHASAGSAVLRAAVAAARPFPRLKILALTVITSLSDSDLPEIGLQASVQAQVLRLARLAAECGCDGVVASAQEAELLRRVLPSTMQVVIPGVQLSASAANDQARIGSPHGAALAGATHIVVGRAITKAGDPRQAFAQAAAQFIAGISTSLLEPG